MSEPTLPSLSDLPTDDALLVHRRCRDFEAAWKNWSGGPRPELKDWLSDLSGDVRAVLLGDLLRLDVEYRCEKAKERPVPADYLDDFRADEAILCRIMLELANIDDESPPDSTKAHTPHGGVDETGEQATPPAWAMPEYIGGYRVKEVLGEGGFGVVYLARDEQLNRDVAIKVPHRKHISGPEGAEAYLAEARTAANLEHANIVPVHHVGKSDDFPFYLVSKYIDGTSLAKRIAGSRLAVAETVELVATIAEAVHYAHKQGIVHRDLKPGNILLDRNAKPFVADFGLALREEDVGTGPHYAGTPPYMSPEQARGEGNQVDGRSDIFSLGVVLYELLVGRRPFHAKTREELRLRICTQEARPPRQWDDTIPQEVESICLKALSKRPQERYTTAKDMAEDLRQLLRSSVRQSDSARLQPAADVAGIPSTSWPTPASDPWCVNETRQPSTGIPAPPRQAPSKLFVGLAVCMLLAGVGFAAVALRRGESPRPAGVDLPAGPRSLDDLKRDAPFQLLERKPLPVGWDPDNARWQQWNADEKLLQVTGGPSRLFVLGTTTLPSYDIGVDIKQAPWTGEVGIFWGFHEDAAIKQRRIPKQEFAWFQFLRIEHRVTANGEAVRCVHRGRGSLRYNHQHDVAVGAIGFASQNIRFLAGQVHLKIEVKGNRLANAEIAHESLAGLCTDEVNNMFQNDPYRGGIGLLALSHTATFSEVRFVSRSTP